MADVQPFPWASAMRFGFGHLRLPPEAFWSMTMHELNSAMTHHFGDAEVTLSRQKLDQLILENPDKEW